LLGPEGWEAYSNSVHLWAVGLFCWIHRSVKSSVVECRSSGSPIYVGFCRDCSEWQSQYNTYNRYFILS
jgi:hypothetical protein